MSSTAMWGGCCTPYVSLTTGNVGLGRDRWGTEKYLCSDGVNIIRLSTEKQNW